MAKPKHCARRSLSSCTGLLGVKRAKPGGKSGRGFEADGGIGRRTPDLGYTHPYYWAPFVLIGNFQ